MIRLSVEEVPGASVCARQGVLAAHAAGQFHVFAHDGHALGVDGAQVGVLEEGD